MLFILEKIVYNIKSKSCSEVINMANNIPKPSAPEKDIKTFNPTKSKAGKIIIVILAMGMFLATVVAAIVGMIQVLK